MSSINLSSLSSRRISKYTYKDVDLDIKTETNVLPRGLYREENITDIKASLDEAAIKNSLSNIFNTAPGQKLLAPNFGLDLKYYLFDPLSEDIGQNIGETIIQGLKQWEPRVIVNRVHVFTDYDQNQYVITLHIAIPTLNISEAQYTGALNNEGFTFNNE
tara:strand:+ start:978 stop:1457 length:480 start_codon:yes stop_codon:yes gene_type:complete